MQHLSHTLLISATVHFCLRNLFLCNKHTLLVMISCSTFNQRGNQKICSFWCQGPWRSHSSNAYNWELGITCEKEKIEGNLGISRQLPVASHRFYFVFSNSRSASICILHCHYDSASCFIFCICICVFICICILFPHSSLYLVPITDSASQFPLFLLQIAPFVSISRFLAAASHCFASTYSSARLQYILSCWSEKSKNIVLHLKDCTCFFLSLFIVSGCSWKTERAESVDIKCQPSSATVNAILPQQLKMLVMTFFAATSPLERLLIPDIRNWLKSFWFVGFSLKCFPSKSISQRSTSSINDLVWDLLARSQRWNLFRENVDKKIQHKTNEQQQTNWKIMMLL